MNETKNILDKLMADKQKAQLERMRTVEMNLSQSLKGIIEDVANWNHIESEQYIEIILLSTQLDYLFDHFRSINFPYNHDLSRRIKSFLAVKKEYDPYDDSVQELLLEQIQILIR